MSERRDSRLRFWAAACRVTALLVFLAMVGGSVPVSAGVGVVALVVVAVVLTGETRS